MPKHIFLDHITTSTSLTSTHKENHKKWKNMLIQPIAIPNFQHIISNSNGITMIPKNDILCKPDGSFSWESLRNEILNEIQKND